MSDVEALLRWWLAIGAMSAAVLPMTLWLGRGLGSSVASLSRLVGPFVLTFIVWWPAAVLGIHFSWESLLIAMAMLAIGLWLWTTSRTNLQIRSNARWLVAAEMVWAVAFLVYALFRRQNPDIAFTEKPMEIALLSSILRSPDVPAPDPWLAGESINYYYFGYQVIGAIAHVAGVEPSLAFNLALASTFASAFTIAVGIAWALLSRAKIPLAGRVAGAALASTLLLISGNLETPKRLITERREALDAGWWDGVGWQASRVIYDDLGSTGADSVQTINEFPAFSFVLADLHPHVIGLPFFLAILALSAGIFLRPTTAQDRLRLACIGALAGMMYAINSWDAPVMLAAAVIAVAAGSYRARWRGLGLRLGSVFLGAAVAVAPFALSYNPPVGLTNAEMPSAAAGIPLISGLVRTVGIVTWRPSSTGELLLVYGHWIALAVVTLLALFPFRRTLPRLQPHLPWLIVAGFIWLAIAALWAPAVIWLGVPIALGGLGMRYASTSAGKVASALLAAGFTLALVPEFVFVQDAFGHRMNTVFKFGYQAWILLSIGSAVALVLAFQRARPALRAASAVVGVVALVATLTYTPVSASDWIDIGPEHPTLDGASFIADHEPDEKSAIEWLTAHAREGDALVEAPGCGYGAINGIPMNRFSAFTGVPTVIGWDNHERQWRRSPDNDIVTIVAERQRLANRILDAETPSGTSGLSAPRFLVFGVQEQRGSPNCEVAPQRASSHLESLLASGWEVAFQSGEVSILVRQGDPLAAATGN